MDWLYFCGTERPAGDGTAYESWGSCEEQVSEEFHAEQVDETTLVLTMNFTEKVKVLEDYGVTEHVYTLREFVQEEDGEEFDPDVPDPYGSGDEAYEECYLELKDLLYRVKKKITVELKYEEGVTI